jgi:hypothetical protein
VILVLQYLVEQALDYRRVPCPQSHVGQELQTVHDETRAVVTGEPFGRIPLLEALDECSRAGIGDNSTVGGLRFGRVFGDVEEPRERDVQSRRLFTLK